MTIKSIIQKVVYAIFYCVYYMFARHLPVSYKPYAFGSKWIRYWVCKHLFAECGKNVNIEHGADIGAGRYTKIGDNSGIGVNCRVTRAIIGKNVMIGPEVVFVARNHNFSEPNQPLQNQGYNEFKTIEVGDNVWIGTRVIVLPGRTIGKDAVIGAGSVVTKDVPDYAVVAGNPARIIRFRTKENSVC
jgi:maltose O-acetyltransferase